MPLTLTLSPLRVGRGKGKPKPSTNFFMGKILPRSFEKLRSGEQIQLPTFTNVAAANAAGVTAALYPRRMIYLSAGGTGSVPCLAISDGTNWKQVAIGTNAI
jgi:hypothetical protein